MHIIYAYITYMKNSIDAIGNRTLDLSANDPFFVNTKPYSNFLYIKGKRRWKNTGWETIWGSQSVRQGCVSTSRMTVEFDS